MVQALNEQLDVRASGSRMLKGRLLTLGFEPMTLQLGVKHPNLREVRGGVVIQGQYIPYCWSQNYKTRSLKELQVPTQCRLQHLLTVTLIKTCSKRVCVCVFSVRETAPVALNR